MRIVFRLLRYLLYAGIYLAIAGLMQEDTAGRSVWLSVIIFWAPLWLFLTIELYLKSKRKLLPEVATSFEASGLTILRERTPVFRERLEGPLTLEPVYPALFTGIPNKWSSYKRRYIRVFRVKDKEGRIYDCYTEIRQLWGGQFNCEVLRYKAVTEAGPNQQH